MPADDLPPARQEGHGGLGPNGLALSHDEVLRHVCTGHGDPELWVHRDVLHRTSHVHEPTVAHPIVVVVVPDSVECFTTLPQYAAGSGVPPFGSFGLGANLVIRMLDLGYLVCGTRGMPGAA